MLVVASSSPTGTEACFEVDGGDEDVKGSRFYRAFIVFSLLFSDNFMERYFVQTVDRPQKNGVKKFSGGRVKQRMREDLNKGVDMQWMTQILLPTGTSFVVAEHRKF